MAEWEVWNKGGGRQIIGWIQEWLTGSTACNSVIAGYI